MSSEILQEVSQSSNSWSAQTQKLDTYLKQKTIETRAIITMQTTPDPDSMASALGLQWILDSIYGIQAEIIAKDPISHPQNLTMRNVLDIPIKEKSKYDLSSYDLVCVVDTVPQNTGFENDFNNFDIVLDHHQFELDLPITDIRSCGSCSSIVWSYLEDFGVDWGTEKGIQVATALMFGVLNDTHDLLSENTNSLDTDAHAHLISKVDRKKLSEILNYSIPSYFYDLRGLAVENKIIQDSMLISSLGTLTRKKRDALPLIADEFMRMEGVETVVVHAIIDDYVVASVRSKNSSINVHDFCQRIFGPKHAGGKPGAGGAKTPLGFLFSSSDSEELKEELCLISIQILNKRILSFMSGG